MEWMEPMEPVLLDSVITENDWIHRLNGMVSGTFHMSKRMERGCYRSGRERIAWYPEIAGIRIYWAAESGPGWELIVLNEGKPSSCMSRERVQRKERLKHYQRSIPFSI